MSKYETVAVPFITIGNKQVLTDSQLDEQPWLREFIERFRHCFEHDDVTQYWIFKPPEA
jgi:hypothetical protein